MSSERPGARSIQSDETLFDVIEYLYANQGAGVTEIASGLGRSKSTIHGHLTSLKERGYVVRTDAGYRLGLEFLNHGKLVQTSYDLYSIAHKKVVQIASETGERAWCMVEENGLAYYLAGAEGDQSVHPPVRVGKSVHLHPRAAGKAILAHLEESTVREIIDRYGLPPETPNTITSEEALFRELETIREQGYAINDSESLEGLYAIGAPIIDTEETVCGALCISGPAKRMKNEARKTEVIELLLGATNELEINLMRES